MTNETLLSAEPASRDLPLPVRVHELNVITRHQGGRNLVHLHQREVATDANVRAAAKGEVRGVEQLEPPAVRLVVLVGGARQVALQPALGAKGIGVVAPDAAVPRHDVRVDAHGRAGGDEAAVGEGQAGLGHVALEEHADARVDTRGFADNGF